MERQLERRIRIKETIEELLELTPLIINKAELTPRIINKTELTSEIINKAEYRFIKMQMMAILGFCIYGLTYKLELRFFIHLCKQIHVSVQKILQNIENMTLPVEIIKTIRIIKNESDELLKYYNIKPIDELDHHTQYLKFDPQE